MLDQNELIKMFKNRFPDYSLKDIAELTGINKTRLFRILRGQEMKLSEFNKFDSLLHENTLQKVVLQCSESLPHNHLEKLHSILERHLDSYLLAHDMKTFCSNKNLNRSIA